VFEGLGATRSTETSKPLSTYEVTPTSRRSMGKPSVTSKASTTSRAKSTVDLKNAGILDKRRSEYMREYGEFETEAGRGGKNLRCKFVTGKNTHCKTSVAPGTEYCKSHIKDNLVGAEMCREFMNEGDSFEEALERWDTINREIAETKTKASSSSKDSPSKPAKAPARRTSGPSSVSSKLEKVDLTPFEYEKRSKTGDILYGIKINDMEFILMEDLEKSHEEKKKILCAFAINRSSFPAMDPIGLNEMGAAVIQNVGISVVNGPDLRERNKNFRERAQPVVEEVNTTVFDRNSELGIEFSFIEEKAEGEVFYSIIAKIDGEKWLFDLSYKMPQNIEESLVSMEGSSLLKETSKDRNERISYFESLAKSYGMKYATFIELAEKLKMKLPEHINKIDLLLMFYLENKVSQYENGIKVYTVENKDIIPLSGKFAMIDEDENIFEFNGSVFKSDGVINVNNTVPVSDALYDLISKEKSPTPKAIKSAKSPIGVPVGHNVLRTASGSARRSQSPIREASARPMRRAASPSPFTKKEESISGSAPSKKVQRSPIRIFSGSASPSKQFRKSPSGSWKR